MSVGLRMARQLLPAVVVLCLSACGGGGDGGSNSTSSSSSSSSSGSGSSGGSSGGANGGGGGTTAPMTTFTVAPTSLTFLANGPSTATPPAQTVTGTVTGVSSGTLYITIVGSGQAVAGISPVIVTSNSSGQSSVSVPSPASLGIGTYVGSISVTACVNDSTCATGQLGGSPQTVNVSYSVAGIKTSAASLAYTVTNAPQASDLANQLTVTTYPAQNWTASTAAGWLSVTASGKSGDVLNANLIQTALNALDDGMYSTTIHLAPASSGQPLDIPVTVTVKRTEVDYVSPYVAYVGTSGNVIIRGQEFSQLSGTSALQNVLFGSTPAASYTVVSSTEIDATYPATLAVGRYPVVLQTSFTGVHQLANLVVVAAPAFSAAVIPYPDSSPKQPTALVYDAERQALAVSAWYGSTGATSVLRFAYSGGSWQSTGSVSLMNSFALALSADGADWIAGTNEKVSNLDPVSLAGLATTPINQVYDGGLESVFDAAVTNDGTVAVTTFISGNCGSALTFYNPRKLSAVWPAYSFCRARVAASGDGSRLVVVDGGTDANADAVYLADTTAGTLNATGLQEITNFDPEVDRSGDRIAVNLDYNGILHWELYDGSLNDLGSLPTSTLVMKLSPDGHKAYAYDQSGLLITYDLTAAPVAGVFPQLGSGITLAGSPGPAGVLGIDIGSNAESLYMSMTPDGGTVFIAGTDAVVVQPVP